LEQRLVDEMPQIPQSPDKMRLLRIWLVLVAASATAFAQTNAPEVRRLSLEDCIQRALQKNLDLQIARYGPPMAVLDLKGSYGGYDPSFSISGDHAFSMSGGGFNSSLGTITAATTSDQNAFNSSLGGLTPWGLNYTLSGNISESYGSGGSDSTPFDQSGGGASIKMTQPLLKNFWIDSTRLNIRVAKNRVKYSELTLKQQIMQTVTTVENAYYDLIYNRENVVVQQKAVELAQQLVTENKKRVEVGAMAPLEEQQAESQAASSLATLIAAKSTLAVQEHLLKQLVTDQYSKSAHVTLEPAGTLAAPRQFFDLRDSWSKGLTQRPDLLQAKLDIERQGITLKYNYNQLFPELDLFGSYGHNASGSSLQEFSDAFDTIGRGSRPTYTYGAQLTFPIPNTSARATYRKSKLTMEQLVLTLKKLEQTIMVQIDNDIKQAESSFQQVGATRTAREYAAAALDAEQKKLESGKSTTYTVLQMQRDLTLARGNEIQALDTYNKALAQLSLDEATTLDRLHIQVEVK
jgi:outer membrane protein TolC